MVDALNDGVRAESAGLVHDDEFVAAQTRHDIRRTHDRQQTARRLAQHQIARVMTVSVVHLLESVEVDVGHRERQIVALRTSKTRFEQLVE